MSYSGLGILLVDDDEGDRRLIRESIKNAGLNIEIMEARSGEDGIKKAEEIKSAIIILDTQLPGIDGFETCRRIKQIKGLETRIIMITGVVDAVDASRARRAGADDYCVKTSGYEVLINAVKNLLSS